MALLLWPGAVLYGLRNILSLVVAAEPGILAVTCSPEAKLWCADYHGLVPKSFQQQRACAVVFAAQSAADERIATPA